jgi:hypothetical protein
MAGEFDPNHLQLTDAELIQTPEAPMSDLLLFVCTYVASLSNLAMDMGELTARLCAALQAGLGGGTLCAVNSNFGHACWPGYEYLLKQPAAAAPAARPVRGRPRKGQGDGTGFNSAIVIVLRLAGSGPEKLYKTKVFPSTGETQVPGVLSPDFSDGHAALELLVTLLNELGVGVAEAPADPAVAPQWAQLRKAAEDAALAGEPALLADYARRLGAHAAAAPPGQRRRIAIARESPKMLNYKFRIVRRSPRILINLVAFATYLIGLETGAAAQVRPPYPIRETTPPLDDVKVSFRFNCGARQPRVNVFQGGKINILGADSVECAERIYEFFVQLFRANWGTFVCLQPRRDRPAAVPAAARRKVRVAAAAVAPAAAAVAPAAAAAAPAAAAVAPAAAAVAPAAAAAAPAAAAVLARRRRGRAAI